MTRTQLTLTLSCLAVGAGLHGAADAAVTLTDTTNITLSNSQVEVGDNTSENPDVTGGLAGPLIAYTPTGVDEIPDPPNWGAANLNDGDVGVGNPSDGFYAILANDTTLVLDFGSTQVLGSVAIYGGYGNRDNGTYTLRDGAGALLGQYEIITPQVPSTNEGVDSIWLTFNTPVVTDQLLIDIGPKGPGDTTGGGGSFREIQVFAVPEPGSLALLGLGGLMVMRRRRN